ncbi:MAG TPA: hypothetical protein VLK29_12725 [Luteimonas sp.]|nr:hypothetical protein [Luteimonas sp.]
MMTNHNPNTPRGKNEDPARSRQSSAGAKPGSQPQESSQVPHDQQGLQGQYANQDQQRNDRRDGQDREDKVQSSRDDGGN